MAAEIDTDRILVPLDGSALAESALPPAMRLARALKRTLVLARVISPDTWAFMGPNAMVPPETYQQMVDEEDRTASEYLQAIAERLQGQGVSIGIEVVRGEAATTLIDLCPRLRIGLVVMCTRGRTGMARMALGSVADQMVRRSHIPVLLLRPSTCEADAALERAVVPLDGSPTAEEALAQVGLLAGVILRRVTLFRVVDSSHVHEAGVAAVEEAERYLEGVRQNLAADLSGSGCAIQTEVAQGEPTQQIIRRSQRDCDLVILATRGRAGARRMMFGSTADRVLHDASVPLLLIHPSGVE